MERVGTQMMYIELLEENPAQQPSSVNSMDTTQMEVTTRGSPEDSHVREMDISRGLTPSNKVVDTEWRRLVEDIGRDFGMQVNSLHVRTGSPAGNLLLPNILLPQITLLFMLKTPVLPQ